MLIFGCIFMAFAVFGKTESALAPTIQLNNGYKVPIVGVGTYLSTGVEAENLVSDAIDVGYRHIDTAYRYEIEKDVGRAVRRKIADGVIKREDIFVVTKLWNTFHKPDLVEQAFNRSFENLDLGYIDLYLMHFPEAYQRVLKDPSLDPNDVDSYQLIPRGKDDNILYDHSIDFVDTWREMEKLLDSGRVRSIGISNFDQQQTERILAVARIVPVTNQVECHPFKNKRSLIKFSSANNITVTAHTPLGRAKNETDTNSPISDPNVLALAKKHNKTAAQTILRYSIQNGALVIPKSTKKHRLVENLDLFDFQLSGSDMRILHTLDKEE